MVDELLGNLVKEARAFVPAALSVLHATVAVRDDEALFGARDGHVHQAALLGDARTALILESGKMRKESLLDARDEDLREFKPLGRMHRHELNGIDVALFVLVARL